MSCIFNYSQTRKVKCLKQTEKEKKLDTYALPSRDQVMTTALGCAGIPFQLGHWSGMDGAGIDTDSYQRNVTIKDVREQLFAQSFSNAYFGSGPVVPFSDEFNKSTHILTNRKRQTQIGPEDKSVIPYQFFYHFDNPQKINPMRTGLETNQDTRMELRRELRK